ncbi:MAG: Phosphoesterase, PA-phosphatase related protein [Phycisphaerales bacterium]|nr:Phosphoesterase, PA-phosphatase related protein [Phycisphaerales bacterium]
MQRRVQNGRRKAGAAGFVTTERLEARRLLSAVVLDQAPAFDAFAQLQRVDLVSTPGSTVVTLRVTYEGPQIDTTTFDNNDLTVSSLQGFHASTSFAGLDATDPGAGHGMRVADYTVQAPFSTFGAVGNQSYNVNLQANQVSDTTLGFMAPTDIGTFQIPAQTANTFTVNVDGQAVGNGQSVNFGDAIGPLATVTKTVTITNTSAGAISPQVNAIQYQNGSPTASPYSIQSGDVIPSTLPAGASTTFHLTFNATGFSTLGQTGHFPAVITVGGTGASPLVALQDVTINATATVPTLTSFTVAPKGSTFIDAAGKKVTIKVTGPGQAVLGFVSSASPFNADPSLLTLTGTTAKTKITISSQGSMTLGGVTADGPIGSFIATRTTLAGNFQAAGAINILTLSAASAGTISAQSLTTLSSSGNFLAGLNVGPAGQAPGAAVLGTVNVKGSMGGVWVINGGVKSVTAAAMGSTFSATVAGQLAKLVIKGNANGNLAALAMGVIQIGGILSNANFLAGESFGADGRINGNETFGPGSIGTFSAGSVVNSVVAAGLDPVDRVFFNGNDVIDGGASSVIKSLTIKRTADNNSRFLAGAIRTAKINGKKVNPAADARFKLS